MTDGPWDRLLSPAAVKALDRLSRTDRERLVTAIQRLPEGDIKRLYGSLTYRLRVGDWRIVFEVNYGLRRIEVLRVAARGSAYRA